MVRSYGPAKLAKERMGPFQGGGPPPAPGGATAPMPTPQVSTGRRVDRETVPIRREYFPPKRRPEPPPEPAAAPPRQPSKRKALEQSTTTSLKPYRVPRGVGHKLPDQPGFEPFSGRAQRLPAEVVDAARQRMMDIARRAQQQTTRKQDFAKLVENEKKHRRGGARGDVVGAGKRKQPEPDEPPSMLRKAVTAPPRGRQRIYDRDTQVFNISA